MMTISTGLWIIQPSSASATMKQLSGQPYPWRYLGNDIFTRRRVERALGKSDFRPLSQELDQTAKQVKQPFLDWMVRIGTRQKNAVAWWCSAIASKSPLQTDFFESVCYVQLVMAWVNQGPEENQIVVVEDPWIYQTLFVNLQGHTEIHWGGGTSLKRCAQQVKETLRAVAVRVYFLLDAFLRMSIGHVRFSTSQSDGTAPSILIFSWVEERSFDEQGDFRDPYMGRLDKILAQKGATTQRLAFLYFPFKLFRHLKTHPDAFVVSAAYLRLFDILLSAFAWFGLDKSGDTVHFQGVDFGFLFTREVSRENSQMQFLRTLLWYRLSRQIAHHLKPTLKTVVYPFENQPWEKVFCLAWKERAPAVSLVGYQHSSVGPFLLNYFLGQDELTRSPLPHRIVANGRMGLNTLKEAGYPEDLLENGGSFRYEYLQFIPHHTRNGLLTNIVPQILVAFPVSAVPTIALLEALLDNFPTGKEPFRFTLKFHPDSPLESIFKRFPSLPENFTVTTRPLKELFEQTDLFLFAPPTTVWWEALLCGLRVLKFRGDFLDIYPIEDMQYRIRMCGKENLKEVLLDVLRPVAVVPSSKMKELLAQVFSVVQEDLWLKLATTHE